LQTLIIAYAEAGMARQWARISPCKHPMTKRKKKVFRATKAVKAAAREQIGSPPPTRLVPDGKKRADEKHKPTLGKILGEGES
jgi:hypothetical protein